MELQIGIYKINIKSNEIDLDVIRTNGKSLNIENHLFDSYDELIGILDVIDHHYNLHFSLKYEIEKCKE